jgi:hypothetical protein
LIAAMTGFAERFDQVEDALSGHRRAQRGWRLHGQLDVSAGDGSLSPAPVTTTTPTAGRVGS